MIHRLAVLFLVCAVLLTGALPALAEADFDAALDYLAAQQNADGGFGTGFSPESSPGSTADVVLAIVAAGGDPAELGRDGNTVLTYLAGKAASVTSGGDLAKLILATTAAGQNPRQFGGVDSVARLEALIGESKIGGAEDTFFAHTLAVLALASVQRPIPPAAVALIEDAQQEGGGWAWDGTDTTVADTNSTAVAVQALVAPGAEAGSPAIADALAYYESIQNEDGGWPYQNPSDFGTPTDANSTAVTIQALLAAGEDPASSNWQADSGQTPVAALEALQNESGAFAWQATMPDDNLLATVQALPALARKPLPFTTMAVGAAAQATAAPTAAATAATAAPATPFPTPENVPVSGGPGTNVAAVLILGGLILAAGGLALRRLGRAA